MSQIKLLSQNINKHTLINNLFIDTYMPSANGDYVKVYIYLLRLVLSNQCDFTTDQLAKQLNLIESDVIRALRYWDELKILEVHMEGDILKSIGMLSLEQAENTLVETVDVPTKSTDPKANATRPTAKKAKLYKRPDYSMEEMTMMANQSEFKQLLYITERYLGKQLTQTDINVLMGFIDWLGLPLDVVDFLIEHCASGGHRHMNYIEKVAIDWAEQNVRTVEQAKALTEKFNKNYYRILKALGIGNRQPTGPQIALMDKWVTDYNFAIEVVELACEKTIAAINKPELKYVDTILSKWHDNGAKSIIDVEKLDALFKKNKQADLDKAKANGETQAKKSNNRFINHEQRTYDYSSLEQRMNDKLDQEINRKRS